MNPESIPPPANESAQLADNMIVGGVDCAPGDVTLTNAQTQSTQATVGKRRSRAKASKPSGEASTSEPPSLNESSNNELGSKRRKVAKTKDASGTSVAESKTTQRRGRVSKLSELPSMPLDILLEIFRELEPTDLIKLSRTNKDFRRLLLNRSVSLSVWKDALQRISGLPECPQGMTEPAWANLVFSPHCHFCLTRTPNIEWLFRVRMCQKCSLQHLLQTPAYYKMSLRHDITLTNPTMGSMSLLSLVPTRNGKRNTTCCLKADYDATEKAYSRLSTVEEKRTYIMDRKELVKQIQEHAHRCQAWERLQTLNRSEEIQQLKQDRKAAIVRKLEELGLGDEVEHIRHPDSLADHKLVNRPQRLTDKVWAHIRSEILHFMEKMKAKRLERDYKALKLTRKSIAMDVIRKFKVSNHPERQCFPEPPDYCKFPPIQEIVDLPANVQVSASTFANILPLLPELFAEWRKQIDGQLTEVVKMKERVKRSVGYPDYDAYCESDYEELMGLPPKKSETPKMSDEEAAAKFNLAATVFECQHCNPKDDSGMAGYAWALGLDLDYGCNRSRGASRLLFYPQVMGHFPCLTRGPYYHFDEWDLFPSRTVETRDPTTYLGRANSKERRVWTNYLQHNVHISTKAEAVVKTAGLDPASATSDDMDKLNLRFVCEICLKLRRKKQAQSLNKETDNNKDGARDNGKCGGSGEARDIGGACDIDEGSNDGESNDGEGSTDGECSYGEGDDFGEFSDFHEGSDDEEGGRSSGRSSLAPGRPVEVGLFEWRAMVRHFEDQHYQVESIIKLSANELGKDIMDAENELKINVTPVWVCMHCIDTESEKGPRQFAELKAHIRDKHDVESPILNEDYCEHYTSSDIRAAHRPLWVHYMDGQVSLIPAQSDTARKYYGSRPSTAQIDSYDDVRTLAMDMGSESDSSEY